MFLSIIIMPLLGSMISGFFGRKIGVRGSHFITCSLVILTTLLAIISYIESSIYNASVSLYLFKWVDTESLNVYWGFNFDSLTVSMLIPVLIVSSLVHVYSIGYMSHDPHNQRFFSYLSLFTFMMVILVTANNYLLMFVGWEGVGICSYLLVSFWFTRIAANQSSISAILTNRVGDCLLTIGMFGIIWTLGNLDYATVFSLSPFINENIVTLIGICLLIGAMAKSSQVGLHVWLPMAMEGPTPVSALIHAATMVTAGVYLLIRSSPFIEYSSTVLLLCLWIGAITTIFSSLIGLFQQDIKKVIAYSTMSQLGLMVVAVGLSSYHVALFHLVNHAFYKALLFLGAGAVIHAVADNQDFRKYGGFKQFLPLSYSVMLIASLSLVAFPYMTGFFSKDFILESSYGGFNLSSVTVYYIAIIGAMFTTLYSIKTLYLAFITNPNGPAVNYRNIHEGNMYMSLPLVILALFSIFFGFITKDIFIGLGSDLFIDNSIFIHPINEIMINTEFAVPTIFKLLPFIFTVLLTGLSLIISGYLFKTLITFKYSRFGYNLFSFFNLRFIIEMIYNKYITENIFTLGGQTTKILDKGVVEYIGPYGLQNGLINLSKNLSSLDTGVVTSYALYVLVGAISYLCISSISIPYNLLAVLLILVIIMLNYFSYTKPNKNIIASLEIEKEIFKPNNSTQNNIVIKSSWIEFFILYIKNSVNMYWKAFNFTNLIIGVILLKVITISIAYLVCSDFIYNNDICSLHNILVRNPILISNYLIISLILCSFIFKPWDEKGDYLIKLLLNIIIINISIFIITYVIITFYNIYFEHISPFEVYKYICSLACSIKALFDNFITPYATNDVVCIGSEEYMNLKKDSHVLYMESEPSSSSNQGSNSQHQSNNTTTTKSNTASEAFMDPKNVKDLKKGGVIGKVMETFGLTELSKIYHDKLWAGTQPVKNVIDLPEGWKLKVPKDAEYLIEDVPIPNELENITRSAMHYQHLYAKMWGQAYFNISHNAIQSDYQIKMFDKGLWGLNFSIVDYTVGQKADVSDLFFGVEGYETIPGKGLCFSKEHPDYDPNKDNKIKSTPNVLRMAAHMMEKKHNCKFYENKNQSSILNQIQNMRNTKDTNQSSILNKIQNMRNSKDTRNT